MTAMHSDWEWVPDEQKGRDEYERSSLIASFIRGATASEEIEDDYEDEEDREDGEHWDGRAKSRYDGAPAGGFGGGDRRSIAVAPSVPQYHGENWMAKVNCKDQGKLFFANHPKATTQALELCRQCKVMEECRAESLRDGDVYHGVVGGMTPSARRRAINRHRRSA